MFSSNPFLAEPLPDLPVQLLPAGVMPQPLPQPVGVAPQPDDGGERAQIAGQVQGMAAGQLGADGVGRQTVETGEEVACGEGGHAEGEGPGGEHGGQGGEGTAGSGSHASRR